MNGLRVAMCAVVMVAGLIAPGAARAEEQKVERAFGTGRRVWMDLSAGNYKIRQGSDDKIVVRWESTDPDAGQMKVTLDARGADASILTHAQNGEFRVTIEVPSRTDLTVRLSAGNIGVEGITGDKDINSWAGNVDVEVKDRNEYRSVDASVTAGDLNASAFDTKTGGLFRSFSWKGPGKYKLEVRLTAGNLRLAK
jgi:hypothetical protein